MDKEQWCLMEETGGRLKIKMPSYQYRDSHVKDKTVSPTVLSLTWESPYLGKTVFILRRGPGSLFSFAWPVFIPRYFRHPLSSTLNSHSKTESVIYNQSKNLRFTAHPYDDQGFSPNAAAGSHSLIGHLPWEKYLRDRIPSSRRNSCPGKISMTRAWLCFLLLLIWRKHLTVSPERSCGGLWERWGSKSG